MEPTNKSSPLQQLAKNLETAEIKTGMFGGRKIKLAGKTKSFKTIVKELQKHAKNITDEDKQHLKTAIENLLKHEITPTSQKRSRLTRYIYQAQTQKRAKELKKMTTKLEGSQQQPLQARISMTSVLKKHLTQIPKEKLSKEQRENLLNLILSSDTPSKTLTEEQKKILNTIAAELTKNEKGVSDLTTGRKAIVTFAQDILRETGKEKKTIENTVNYLIGSFTEEINKQTKGKARQKQINKLIDELSSHRSADLPALQHIRKLLSPLTGHDPHSFKKQVPYSFQIQKNLLTVIGNALMDKKDDLETSAKKEISDIFEHEATTTEAEHVTLDRLEKEIKQQIYGAKETPISRDLLSELSKACSTPGHRSRIQVTNICVKLKLSIKKGEVVTQNPSALDQYKTLKSAIGRLKQKKEVQEFAQKVLRLKQLPKSLAAKISSQLPKLF